jgi:ADP-ribose pyrophosphatase YjhB (NUDIX family)
MTTGPRAPGDVPTVRASGLTAVDERLLLVRQRRAAEDYWLLPGGGVRFGESLGEALRREYLEELGLVIDAGAPLALVESISDDMARYPKHVLHVVLAAPLADPASRPRTGRDQAVREARFFTREELGGLVIRPPIAAFLQACLTAPPDGVSYLGRRW